MQRQIERAFEVACNLFSSKQGVIISYVVDRRL